MTWHRRVLGDPNGTPLVLLHGFLGSAADWAQAVAAGLDRFCCHAFDLPGHGGTPLEDPPTMRGWVDELATTLGAIAPSGVPVVGYSLGGRVALGLARRHPERVRALALVGAGLGITDPEARAIRAALDDRRAADMRRQGLRAFLDDWYRAPLFAGQAANPEALASIVERRAANDPDAMARVIAALSPGRVEPISDPLCELGCPVAWFAGADDPKYAPLARALARDHPSVHVALVPAATHAVHLEAPKALATQLVDFLDPAL